MIVENIYPVDDKKYALACEGDYMLGTIGPSGNPWRKFTSDELETMTEEQRTSIVEFEKLNNE